MLVRIQSPSIELGSSYRSRIEHRFRIAVDPVADRIAWAGIQISRINGLVGKPGTICRITATLESGGHLLVEELHRDLDQSISRASMAMRRAVLRKLGGDQFERRALQEAEVHNVGDPLPAKKATAKSIHAPPAL